MRIIKDTVVRLTSKPNPVIEKIKLTKEQQDEVNKINNREPVRRTTVANNRQRGYSYEFTTNRPISREMGRRRLTRLYGGMCLCGLAWPDYKVTYDVSSESQPAKRIERYYDSCYKKWKSGNKK